MTHPLSEIDDGFPLFFLSFLGVLDRCVNVDDECHKDVQYDVTGHYHKGEEVARSDGTVAGWESEIKLVPNELPIIKKLHREEGVEPRPIIVEIEPYVVSTDLTVGV